MNGLELQNILLTFPEGGQRRTVLDIPYLKVTSGEHVGIRGASGSGKSSLLNVVSGLVLPDRGTVRWGATVPGALPEHQRDRWRGQHIGFVFQDFQLFPELEALENVLLPATFTGWRIPEALIRRGRGLLEQMHVCPTRKVRALSRGEKQRVAIARAVLLKPGIILADEPTASLDEANAGQVTLLLSGYARTLGSTLLVVSRHKVLVEHLENARAKAEASPWNKVSGEGRIGVVASGISRAYLADALAENGWEKEVKVLELGFTWPLPENLLADFMSGCDTVLVLEELQPLVEQDLRALAQERGIDVSIVGKGPDLTIFGEYSTGAVARALAAVLGKEPVSVSGSAIDVSRLPGRPPNLCAGCSHRAMYYAVRKVFGDEAVYSSDIGCYTLGMVPPLRAADFLFCMGSSVSAGSGFAMVSDRPVVGFIGDSTFFHSGMTGLANAVFNKHDVLLVILDNGTTAMTGHQPNPGVCTAVLGEGCNHLDIESVVRGIGVTDVAKVKPFNMRGTLKTIEEMKARSGVRVIIAEEPCMLFARRTLKQNRPQVAEVVTQGEEALKCLAELACPAFRRGGTAEAPVVSVDESQCSGCMVCLQVTPAIRARKRS